MEEGELRAHTRCWCRRQGSNGEQGRALFFFFVCLLVLFCLSRQGFSLVLEPILELALVDQAGLALTKICLPLPPEGWD